MNPFLRPSSRQSLRPSATRLQLFAWLALILLTGVGAEYLRKAAATLGMEEELVAAVDRVKTVARGPKPAAVLRKWGVPADVTVPEPNTWREVVDAMKGLEARTVAVQEYGASNPELTGALEAEGLQVTAVPVYRWAPPEDLSRLEEAARRIADGAADIVVFLSSVQLTHLLQTAAGLGLEVALRKRLQERIVIASIGPVMTEALAREGLVPDFTPEHPKLAICIRQLSRVAPRLLKKA